MVAGLISLEVGTNRVSAVAILPTSRGEDTSVASLFVIQGADQGKRFELKSKPMALGRDHSNPIRLHDTEVSRRHAELRPVDDSYRIIDLGSANGTFVNGQPVDQAPLRPGDRLQLGQTVMLFNAGNATEHDLTTRVDMLSHASPDDHSAILRSIPVGEGSRVLQAPDIAGGWLKDRLMNLSVMYRATQAISHVLDTDALLPQILELVFESIGADRGAVLLKDDEGNLVPKAVRWRGVADPDERMAISRTIVDHVLGQGQGVITSDASGDKRFSPAQSIVEYGIREAICVPLQGRHVTLGVLYADTRSNSGFAPINPLQDKEAARSRFSQDHLMLMVAIGHQAGLAIENTVFYHDKIQAERLAAVGQTIATLSHHIKNILQGIRGGSYLIDMGLNEKDDAIVRRGWTIVEKNQGKIYNLVMDMLSFSKDREPALESADLNETVADVVELMQSRAKELNVALDWRPSADLSSALIDPDGIHRAVLNIVTNAIDAAEGVADARVKVSTSQDVDDQVVMITVADNGVGINEADIASIFQVFASTKGARGTGLGLPVSQKIIREHGGKIVVLSKRGQGSQFIIELPMRRPESSKDNSGTGEGPVMPG
jgi:signal transduction histidine kinase